MKNSRQPTPATPVSHGPASRRGRRPWQAAGRALGLGLTAALVLFHVLLLWQRVESLTLFQPGVALRWTAGALLGWAFLRLRRAGASLLKGRGALVLWVLVALLHASAAVPLDGARVDLAAEPGTALLLTLTLAALGSALASRAAVRRPPRPASAFDRLAPARLRRVFLGGALEPLSPRPPPA